MTKLNTQNPYSMDAKIQELTEKIYNEGVEKGQTEANRLIAEAEAKAQKIEAEAKRKAEEYLKNAEQRASELRQHTEAELQLYASQLVDSLRSSIADQIQGSVAQSSVKAITEDKDFLQSFVGKLAERFDLQRGIEITTADADALRAYFTANAKSLLEEGKVRIRAVAGKPTDFTIAPQDGSFKVQFGQAEFLELFKSFLRPELTKMLF